MRKITKFLRYGDYIYYYFPTEETDEKNLLAVQATGYRTTSESEICEKCGFVNINGEKHGVSLDETYVEIIDKLKKAGLLEEDYPLICCKCFQERELIPIIDEINSLIMKGCEKG